MLLLDWKSQYLFEDLGNTSVGVITMCTGIFLPVGTAPWGCRSMCPLFLSFSL